MKKTYLLLICFISAIVVLQAQKKALDHDVYDNWKDLNHSIISQDGNWISYEINPQEGDGWLYLANSSTGKLDSVPRGYKASFSVDGNFIVYHIKAPYDSTRAAKLKKKKGKDLPQDSLGIWNISANTQEKFANLKSFQLAEIENKWLAFQVKTIEEESDDEESDDSNSEKKKEDAYSLQIRNLVTGTDFTYDRVESYQIAKNGLSIGIIQNGEDTLETKSISIFQAGNLTSIHEIEGEAKSITLSEDGGQASFIASADTGKQKVYDLYYWQSGNAQADKIVDAETAGMTDGWIVSEDSRMRFSRNGDRLFFGTIPKPAEFEEDKDILDEEKVSIDIWHWQDQRLQPMQLVRLSRDKKFNYPAVYHTQTNNMTQLADEVVHDIRMAPFGGGEYALGISNRMLMKSISWESPGRSDVYVVNMNNGRKTPVSKALRSYSLQLSPNSRYLIWFATADSVWYTYDISSGETRNLIADLPVTFYNRLDDRPQPARPYRVSGWGKDDAFVLINDEYDIWKIDPTGQEAPTNVTQGFGRKNGIRFTHYRLNPDEPSIDPKETLLLKGVDAKTRAETFYELPLNKKKEPQELFTANYALGRPTKAKNADQLIWTKGSFVEYPDLWTSGLNFKKQQKVSNTNPQQKDYKWGTVELVAWKAFDGQTLEGLLYKPDDFDPNKKYPLMVYFYERNADRLHRHYVPQPIRSSTYPSMYVSNDYIYFIPDVTYKTGQPGDDAYNCVVSGTEYIAQNSWIDKDKMGIQGHSWGGYQIAYLLTKTNIYAAAEAGAPVVNMTSAYGGIRWASGMSRMFQYEQTQSRLGGTLWEVPELYLKNSPLFELDKVETPVMFMHNDNDGAVPWYQGIEYFVGLRRLNKPVWMLNYNGEGHGLSKRHNKRDFAIRMKQFFDHYLKDAPAPEWMVKGIPAIEKGKTMGLDLVKAQER